MDYVPAQKMARHLDFTRETFNEPNLPSLTEGNSRLPSSYNADDELSTVDSDVCEASRANQSENINVFLRLRPVKENCNFYKFNDNTVIITKALQPNHATNTESHYTFTSVLNDSANQVEIYNEIVRPVLSKPFDIRGSTFASYGVSSSGKTYTILGDTSAGLVPRAITQIFTEYGPFIASFPYVKIINDQVELMSDENVDYENGLAYEFSSNKATKKLKKNWSHEDIKNEHQFQEKDDIENTIDHVYFWISFIEIHNEKIVDLLHTNKETHRALKIFSNGGNSYIRGATWLFASNIEAAFNILSHGLDRIKYAATGINDHSSRSHTILTINLIAESGSDFQLSSFKFCDLAGAERTKKTLNTGDRLKEAGGINTSLLVLGRCLEAVQQNQTKINKKLPDVVIPVRDSKLTLLLQSSLLGHEKFVMIVNLYPTFEFFEENVNVLKFGSIASQIVVKKSEARKFKRSSYSYFMTRPGLMNNSLRNQSVNATISEEPESNNESDLDDSFKWSSMSNSELIGELQYQKMYINELKKKYIEREREMYAARLQILEKQQEIQDRIVKGSEDDLRILREYHEKKMENQRIRYERIISELRDDNNYLEGKLKKCTCGQGFSEEDTDEEYSDEDVIEID